MSQTPKTPASRVRSVLHPTGWLTRRRYNVNYVRNRMRYLTSIVGKQFFAFSLLMRLPTWMSALAVLVIMSSRTGEITLGTYGAGLIALASAMSHRTYRVLSHRFGVRGVLTVAATLNIPAVAFLLVQMLDFIGQRTGGSILTFLLASTLAGVTTPPLGAMMRSYWSHRYSEYHDRRELNTSTTFESVLDIVALPVAASIVGLIAILGGLNAPLYAVIVIDLLGIMFVLWRPGSISMRSADLHDFGSFEKNVQGSAKLGWLPVLGISCLGICIGSAQTMLAFRAISQDSVTNIGFYLGAMGSAGAIACVVMTLLRSRVGTWQGWTMIATALTLVSLLMSVPQSTPGLLLLLALFGAVLGAGLLSIDSIITSLSARGNIDLAHSTAQATFIAGIALGYVWGGVFGARFGVQSALLVPVISSAAYFILAHIYGYKWRKKYEERLAPLPEDLSLPRKG